MLTWSWAAVAPRRFRSTVDGLHLLLAAPQECTQAQAIADEHAELPRNALPDLHRDELFTRVMLGSVLPVRRVLVEE